MHHAIVARILQLGAMEFDHELVTEYLTMIDSNNGPDVQMDDVEEEDSDDDKDEDEDEAEVDKDKDEDKDEDEDEDESDSDEDDEN